MSDLELENDSRILNQELDEPSIHQQIEKTKHTAEVARLKNLVEQLRDEVKERKRKYEDAKRHSKSRADELVRTYQSKVNGLESEVRSLQDRLHSAESSKSSTAKELEDSLAQTISLYSLIQQHQTTIEQQRAKCEFADAQFNQTMSKLRSSEREVQRLRTLHEREKEAESRHIATLKGQLSAKTDECLQTNARLEALQAEYESHRKDLESKISSLEKDRSILEAVNFELHNEKEKCFQLNREVEAMKADLLRKSHVEGQLESALEQVRNLSATLNRLEDERAKWVGERRDLDHALGEYAEKLKSMTAERDALTIDKASLAHQLEEERKEFTRKMKVAEEAAQRSSELHATQIAERDDMLNHARNQVEMMQKEIDQLRADKKQLESTVAKQDESIRTLTRQQSIQSEQLAKVQAELDDRTKQLLDVSAANESVEARLSAESQRVERLRSSQAQLVDRMESQVDFSSIQLVFARWRFDFLLAQANKQMQQTKEHEHRAQEQWNDGQEQLARLIQEKAEVEAQMAKQQQQHDAALASMRAEFESERQRLQSEYESNSQARAAAFESDKRRALELAREDWTRQAALQADEERREKEERELRIVKERERIRQELEEARQREMEEKKKREETVEQSKSQESIARRPSVQSLVAHTVDSALLRALSPLRVGVERGRSRSSHMYDESASVSEASTTTSSAYPSEREKTRSRMRARSTSASTSKRPCATPGSISATSSMPPSQRSQSLERPHRHHHHHLAHDQSSRTHHHHHHKRATSSQGRSASPPAVVVHPVSFTLPTAYAPFVQHMGSPMSVAVLPPQTNVNTTTGKPDQPSVTRSTRSTTTTSSHVHTRPSTKHTVSRDAATLSVPSHAGPRASPSSSSSSSTAVSTSVIGRQTSSLAYPPRRSSQQRASAGGAAPGLLQRQISASAPHTRTHSFDAFPIERIDVVGTSTQTTIQSKPDATLHRTPDQHVGEATTTATAAAAATHSSMPRSSDNVNDDSLTGRMGADIDDEDDDGDDATPTSSANVCGREGEVVVVRSRADDGKASKLSSGIIVPPLPLHIVHQQMREEEEQAEAERRKQEKTKKAAR